MGAQSTLAPQKCHSENRCSPSRGGTAELLDEDALRVGPLHAVHGVVHEGEVRPREQEPADLGVT